MHGHYITPALRSSCVTELSPPHEEWMLKGQGGKEINMLQGLECACLLLAVSAGLLSPNTANAGIDIDTLLIIWLFG